MRQTKIVATIGPSSRDPATLEALVRAGVDVVRLNFSHGDHAQHLELLHATRAIGKRLGQAVAVLQDLAGPKIRTGDIAGDTPIELRDGARIRITTDESVLGTTERISTTYEPLPRDVSPGDTILVDDGNIELKVVGISADEVDCEVVYGGPLDDRKGMNLPGVKLSTPALTEKDLRDLEFGVRHGVDYVALSFVRRAADVRQCREATRSLGRSIPIIAKIEKREAIEDLDAIIQAADGVMVARGDLGVELSTEEVPVLQKRIIERTNRAGKVVITATQMLESMIDHARPTRAEASDVANAILDGTDAIMLSGETAAGRFPVETVETMARIARHTEKHYSPPSPDRVAGGPSSLVARSLARVASTVAEELKCKLIVAFTDSGSTARLVSSYRPKVPIASLTYSEDTYNQISMWRGTIPILMTFTPTIDAMIEQGETLLKTLDLVSKGDTVVMLAGQKHASGATNMLRVHKIS